MNKRHLEAKGSFDYDYGNDMLFFKVDEREYSHSIEMKDYVIDVDTEGYVVGLQIFEASHYFDMSKVSLREVKNWQLKTLVENNYIEIRLVFNVVIRNKIVEKNPILVQKVEEEMVDSSVASCIAC